MNTINETVHNCQAYGNDFFDQLNRTDKGVLVVPVTNVGQQARCGDDNQFVPIACDFQGNLYTNTKKINNQPIATWPGNADGGTQRICIAKDDILLSEIKVLLKEMIELLKEIRDKDE